MTFINIGKDNGEYYLTSPCSCALVTGKTIPEFVQNLKKSHYLQVYTGVPPAKDYEKYYPHSLNKEEHKLFWELYDKN